MNQTKSKYRQDKEQRVQKKELVVYLNTMPNVLFSTQNPAGDREGPITFKGREAQAMHLVVNARRLLGKGP